MDKILKATDDIAKVFEDVFLWTFPEQAAVVKILSELVEEKFTSHNTQIMPVCPHAKVKLVVCDCSIKKELNCSFLDCNGEGTYSVTDSNGFGYSRQCGKIVPGKPA